MIFLINHKIKPRRIITNIRIVPAVYYNWLQQTPLLFVKAVNLSNKLQDVGYILWKTTVKK